MILKSYDVCVIGELNPDLILTGDVVPEFNQIEKLVDQATLAIGSSSAIFACGVARLGLRVAFAGKVGQDQFGEFMCSSLEDVGVDTRGIIVDPLLKTGLSVILSKGNDRAILTFPGTIPHLHAAEIDPTWLIQARHLHVGSYYLQDALRPGLSNLFTFVRQAGLSISLDPNYDPSEKWDGELIGLLSKIDIFLPNMTECCAIARFPDLDHATRYFSDRVGLVGVKLGAEGALARQGESLVRLPSLPVEVVDTVGAGDSFDAGFIYGYLVGWDLLRTLQMAVVCGGLSTRQAGGTAAQPDLTEALSHLSRIP
jgi:sugar/nucleoside kinase (ribokinase family)